MEWYEILLIVVAACVLLGALIYLFILIRPRKYRHPDPTLLTSYAHRGLHGGGIPENSLAAFERACEAGYGIELDVQLSKDGEVMVFHDYTLIRMTGREEKLSELERGVKIYAGRDDVTSPATVRVLERATLLDISHLLDYEDSKMSKRRGELPVYSGTITITEGKKHQVKRMIRYAGNRVLYLKRLSIAGLTLDPELRAGEYRALTEEELTLLRGD